MSTTRLVIAGVFLLIALLLVMGTSPQPGVPRPESALQSVGPQTVTIATSPNGYVITTCTNSGGQRLCVNYTAVHDTNPSGWARREMWQVFHMIGPVTFTITGTDTTPPRGGNFEKPGNTIKR